LQLEMAVINDLLTPLVKATYECEGEGDTIVHTHSHILRAELGLKATSMPNVAAKALHFYPRNPTNAEEDARMSTDREKCVE